MNIVTAFKGIVPRGLWPYLGATRRWLRTIPPQTLLQKRLLLSNPSLSNTDRELLDKVNSRIYYRDTMYAGDGAHYFKVGLSAIKCIDEALARAPQLKINSILDLPSGSGRVLRFLVHRFRNAEITACDVEEGPVRFCARTFGAEPVCSSTNLNEVSFSRNFNLIWCGSLITHLNESGILNLLRLFKRSQTPGGLLIFTTHGDFVAGRLPKRDFDYLLEQDQIYRISARYALAGFAFENYQGATDWGVSLTSPQWIRTLVEGLGGYGEVFFKKQGWDNHQDVFAFQRL